MISRCCLQNIGIELLQWRNYHWVNKSWMFDHGTIYSEISSDEINWQSFLNISKNLNDIKNTNLQLFLWNAPINLLSSLISGIFFTLNLAPSSSSSNTSPEILTIISLKFLAFSSSFVIFSCNEETVSSWSASYACPLKLACTVLGFNAIQCHFCCKMPIFVAKSNFEPTKNATKLCLDPPFKEF